jgi:gamma-glutamyltranspeptidase/glutathione hydrolase
LLNNRMIDFSLDPIHPNVLQPGKRTMHTLNTIFVLRDGQVYLSYGTPGGDGQVQTNVQLLARVIDHGLNVQQAIEAPRWRDEGTGLRMEAGFARSVQSGLAERGHPVVEEEPASFSMGGAELIRVNEHGVREAGADPRREGYASAY